MSIDFSNMTSEELDKLADEARHAAVGRAYGAARELPEPVATSNRTTSPPRSPQDEYAATAEAWLSNEFDFTVPSGSLCRLRRMPVEELVAAGIIDKVTRLPAFAQELIDKSEGQPPTELLEMPTPEQMQGLTDILNIMLPLVVVQPYITPMPEDGQDKIVGRIYPDNVDLEDRIAIMERVMSGVRKLDKFRQRSSQSVRGVVDVSLPEMPSV